MNNTYVREKLVLKKTIRNKITKLLLTIIVILIGMISLKLNPKLKEVLNEKIYKKNISLIENRNIYEKYFGNIFIKDKISPVISNKISYSKEEKYKDGVLLTVEKNYPVPIIENGIIIYIDEEKIILEQIDGIKTSYSNLKNTNHKLYDYLEKGEILGETTSNNLYLSFEKEGEYLDYKKYI